MKEKYEGQIAFWFANIALAIVAIIIVAGITISGYGFYKLYEIYRFKTENVGGNYVRSVFGSSWIDADKDCQNTRAEVLIRDDDDGIVTYADNKKCVVVSGIWYDPYTDKIFTQAKDLDIDHFVPLANAYKSGADKWDKATRIEYANYLQDPHHLLAVSLTENRKKGAKSPDQYLPPNKDFRCEYVLEWKNIKTKWNLTITAKENKIVNKILSNCNNSSTK